MSTISSSTTSTTAYKVTADTTGTLVIQTGATPTTAVTVGTDQSVTLAGNLSVTGTTTTTGYINVPNTFGFKNRIINGAMVIDQRNAGASVSVQTTTTYTLDRWHVLAAANSKYTVQQNNGSVTPPTGFSKYFGVSVAAAANVTVGATDQYLVRQGIEGFNMADLSWGTASAKSITLSFWVRSSLTGTFGGSLNGGGGGSTYSYPFSYSISSANTWEYKTITITGQTSGTWSSDNTLFTWIGFDLGVGSTYSGTAGSWANTYYAGTTGAVKVIQTNSATWYITGVQVEVGSTATSFDYRPYGTELMLCQRYYQNNFSPTLAIWYGSSAAVVIPRCVVSMRAAPTVSVISGVTKGVDIYGIGGTTFTSDNFDYQTVNGFRYHGTTASAYPTGQPGNIYNNFLQASAEL